MVTLDEQLRRLDNLRKTSPQALKRGTFLRTNGTSKLVPFPFVVSHVAGRDPPMRL